MSVEIAFPLEFLVTGRPVSHQAKRRDSVSAWRDRVREASYSALPEGHYLSDGPIAVTLFYFPETEMAGDIDNIVKPILDAMLDTSTSTTGRSNVFGFRNSSREEYFQFAAPSAALIEAVDGDKPVLYVHVSDDVSEGLV